MSVYLYLFHGRDNADRDMQAWGSEGPAIGPLSYVHTTYGSDVKICAPRDVLEKFFPDTDIHFHDGFGQHAIQIEGDCLPYGGKFYGDWSVCTQDRLRPPTKAVKPVCDHCGSDNVTKDAVAVWDVETQAWVLLSTYDSTTCQQCERESDDMLDWKSMDGAPAPDPDAIAAPPANDPALPDADVAPKDRT
ncbi:MULTISPECIES: hypothetical protein [Sphingomonadaceae]|jgi:hypothetical protein|uniref:Uncharacterized protein n=1 Tax=Sphingobium yanoikuyae TaxID=13690 RepID=A0A177JJK0_SPHYA|nr:MULTISPECIES: hypothetical protein [Sphingobium]RSU73015.1 hypothetical protein BRX37_17235 [Sphingomonas sp. S-NIH.Pt3_0716]AYO75474.1 hypothetical protein EBF16_00195 [Sphingobium yanoikuyae]OAH40974.1 hypothetical protein AX777_22640 [Sphingobium yanoikuyae]PHP17095.1 hypothetical protein CG471_24615 [Sphingobium sp. IP1]QNG49503.1 hypothetical protein H3V42_32265 [Sphingobium yanoikuyae]